MEKITMFSKDALLTVSIIVLTYGDNSNFGCLTITFLFTVV